jgi:hypothetical protein
MMALRTASMARSITTDLTLGDVCCCKRRFAKG